MNEDELQDSLAAWVPPWQRVTKAGPADAEADGAAETAAETARAAGVDSAAAGVDVEDDTATEGEPTPADPPIGDERDPDTSDDEPDYQQPETDIVEFDAVAVVERVPQTSDDDEAEDADVEDAGVEDPDTERPEGEEPDERDYQQPETDMIEFEVDAQLDGDEPDAVEPADDDEPDDPPADDRDYQQPETDTLATDGAELSGVTAATDGVGAGEAADSRTVNASHEQAAGNGPANLAAALEAILLVVDVPVAADVLAEVVEAPVAEVSAALSALAGEYTSQARGFDLRRAAGGWRLYTRGDYSVYVERFVLDGQSVRLTQAALETLAVIAYQQPVTRSRMSAIRGVNCDGVVRTLNTRGLIEECGTQPDSGAFLYRTTPLFLEKLGLDSLDELPPLAPFLPDDVNGFADA